MRNCKAALGACFITVAFAVHAQAASAAECRPQIIMASVDLDMSRRVPLAPVMLNNHLKLMIVDTGGFVGALFPATVRELGLKTGTTATNVTIVTGASSHTTAVVSDFSVGRLHAPNYRFIVSPVESAGEIPDYQPAGLLGQDVLQNYDVDFDFAASKLNLIDPDHCKGKVIYWQSSTLAIVPFRFDGSFHITFPVVVDGKEVTAMLDTGASATTMNLTTARSIFHVNVHAPDVQKVGELKGNIYTSDVYQRQFKSVVFGDVTVTNPIIQLLPDMVTPQYRSRFAMSSLVKGFPDVILGMSTLSKLHIYVAYKERTLYITPAAPPP
jgi:hypothetical protein